MSAIVTVIVIIGALPFAGTLALIVISALDPRARGAGTARPYDGSRAAPVMNLPGLYGDPKFPSLGEAVRFFGRDWGHLA